MLKQLWHHLSKRRQRQFVFMQILIVVASFFEMASLGAVIPFLTVLSEPELVYEYEYLRPFIQFFRINDASQLALPITLTFIALILLSAIVRLVLLWTLVRLSQMAGADLSIDIYRHTLFQDYSIHVARNSSEVINGIITKTTTVTKGVIAPVLNLISTCVTIVGIIAVLLLINVSVTLIGFIGFGGAYLLVIYLTRRDLKKNSQNIAEKSDLMVKSLQEGLEGIREVLINNNQQFYTELYRNSDLQMRRATWRNEVIYSSPRFGMEAIGIGIIALFAYSATLNLGGIDQFLPVLGAFVLGAQKLLPAIQKGYASYSRIKGGRYSLIDVINLLDQPIPDHADLPPPTPNSFNDSIDLKDLSFRYSEDTPWVLKNINLNIPKGSVIGIVGTTGCGKSTLLDILMCLIKPTNGQILINEQDIYANEKNATKKISSWMNIISLVSQNIYLLEGTIEQNIVMNSKNEELNINNFKLATRVAEIDSFVNKFHKRYKTMIGEEGKLLSGGQRQRIVLARAIYKNPQVLFLDEFTSSLDQETEQKIVDNLINHLPHLTLIMVTHKQSIAKRFDKNYKIINGKLEAF